MVEEITMYKTVCDSCGEVMELYDGVIALDEKSAIVDSVVNADDWNYLANGKCYCPNCHKTAWDEEGEHLLAFTKDTENSGSILLGTIIT